MSNQHVLQPSVTSTLFPHLSAERAAVFRVALLGLTALLLLLGYLRLSGAMVAVAAAGVPLLFGLYVYEIWIGNREPIRTFAIIAVAGALLGAVFAFLTGHYVAQTLLLNGTPEGAPLVRILVSAVLFPLIAQFLMVVVPLLQPAHPRSDVLGGFDLGAASALAFVFSSTLVYLTPEVKEGLISVTAATPFALRAILRGLLVPLIDAGTTGLVVASFWLYRRYPAESPNTWTASRAASLAVAAIVQVALGLTSVYVLNSTTVILIYLGVGLALLFWVRTALHTMLLVQADQASRNVDSHSPLDA